MLADFLKSRSNAVNVTCTVGRQGSFEVKIDDQLVHSKLQTMGFPDEDSILENVIKAEQGLPLEKVKESPITDCVLM